MDAKEPQLCAKDHSNDMRYLYDSDYREYSFRPNLLVHAPFAFGLLFELSLAPLI